MPALADDPQALADRVTELEIRYTHQQALTETLSDVIREQQDALDALRRRLARLEDRLADLGEPSPLDPNHA